MSGPDGTSITDTKRDAAANLEIDEIRCVCRGYDRKDTRGRCLNRDLPLARLPGLNGLENGLGHREGHVIHQAAYFTILQGLMVSWDMPPRSMFASKNFSTTPTTFTVLPTSNAALTSWGVLESSLQRMPDT